MVNDLLGGRRKLLHLPAWLVGIVPFGRHSDGRCRALHRPGGGVGNLRVHGIATMF
jgi:hypothetical protein